MGGERYRWKLIFDGNQYTSAGGVATATKFIHEDGVKFMHQGGADAGMAIQPLCEEAEVLLDMSSGGMDPFGPDKPYSMQIAAMYMLHTPAFFKWFTEEAYDLVLEVFK